ncbi:MAG: hypothetical protein JNK15_01095 [Planctomycetes bacterium]|nr:hypothetical protein [Planctomycetota bacterium]
MNPSLPAVFCVASAVVVAPLLAQDLRIARAVLPKPVVLSVAGPGVLVPPTVLAAGTDVTSGVGSSCNAVGCEASLWGQFQVQEQALSVFLTASATVNGAVVPNGSASTSDPSVDVELQVPRAMPVRFQVAANSIGTSGAATGSVELDIVGQPGVEFAFQGDPGSFCSSAAKDFVLDLPAGLVVVRVRNAASLAAGLVGTNCQIIGSSLSLTITPAVVEVAYEPGGCGASLELTPMLDGQRVRCYVGPSYPGTAVWLVFGLQPANVALPLGSGCPLLVDPAVVLPIQPMAFTMLPIAALGPIELQVQGVMLQQPLPWQPAPALLSSARAVVTVR